MVAVAEVIDLTGLSSSSPIRPHSGDRTDSVDRTVGNLKNSAIDKDSGVSLEDGELFTTTKPANPKLRKQRKRKISQQDSAPTKGEDEENGDKRRRREDKRGGRSRENSHSPADRTVRRRAPCETPSDSLFFVDDKPADIRDAYVSFALAGPSGTQQNDGLVLPPHVKVSNSSSDAQEPSLVEFSNAEEGEDFIDYLDIDGDRSVCISHRALATMYTNPENKRLEFLVTSMIPTRLIPKLDSPVKIAARKAITKPGIVPIKSFVFLLRPPCGVES